MRSALIFRQNVQVRNSMVLHVYARRLSVIQKYKLRKSGLTYVLVIIIRMENMKGGDVVCCL
jgi:hypothetical protein